MRGRVGMRLGATAVAAAALLLSSSAAVAAPGDAVEVLGGGGAIEWRPVGHTSAMVLTVSRPDGSVTRHEIAAGQGFVLSLFDGAGQALADGQYQWEVKVAANVEPGVRRRLDTARRRGDDAAVQALRAEGRIREGAAQSGSFRIHQGAFVLAGDASEEPRGPRQVTANAVRNVTAADQVIPDDLIVQQSLCVGFDCVNNESFGFDTIRLKENNTRIKFEDTSTGTFPTNDWQLTANDSASGGQSKFSIEDITGARVPFTVEAGATTNSIYVDSTGRVGFRTSTPVLDLHVNTSNTPGIRLEQNNSGGFTAQTWDIAGNEANFFVRDVTSGSRLPFRIRPGAPTSSVDISAVGDVGIGTASPANSLHVARSDGTSKLLIEENSGTNAARELLELRNLGGVAFILDDESDASRWTTSNVGSQYLINNQANGGVEFTLGATGSLTIAGTLTQGSSRTIKQAFSAVDTTDVLAKVLALPITTWSYTSAPAVRHIGPMAEDFFDAFGVGIGPTGISVTDSAGVALAAIQALNRQIEAKDGEIAALRERVSELESLQERLAALEALIAAPSGN